MRMTPDQERRRERFEALIGAMAPVLDFVLAAGDQVARRLGASSAPESFPIRSLESRRSQEGSEPDSST
jgi:predicted amidohydrolase YtcJ